MSAEFSAFFLLPDSYAHCFVIPVSGSARTSSILAFLLKAHTGERFLSRCSKTNIYCNAAVWALLALATIFVCSSIRFLKPLYVSADTCCKLIAAQGAACLGKQASVFQCVNRQLFKQCFLPQFVLVCLTNVWIILLFAFTWEDSVRIQSGEFTDESMQP